MLSKVILQLFIVTIASIGNVSSEQQQPQRSILLTSWLGVGKHSVRHGTVAINVHDADGNVVPNKSIPRKLRNGSVVYDCSDLMGRTRAHGDDYQRPNHRFIYRCDNGTERIVACIGSNRSGKAIIKAGETLTKEGFWHKCTHNPRNETAYYSEEAECLVNGKRYHVGEDIRSGFFLMKCQEDGYKIVGCYYSDDNNKEHQMKPGSENEVDGIIHHCADNDGTIHYYTTATQCTMNGKKYEEGERFKQNHLNYECENGLVNIIGCYINEQRDLPIGEDVVEKAMVYRCFKRSGVVYYEEYACGSPGNRSCELKPIPASIDDQEILPEELKRPGFKSLSIAQNVRNGNSKSATVRHL